MSYTPKLGDRVTSPLLVGEWEVRRIYGQWMTEVSRDDALVTVPTSHLTPVAPPLPPEPPVGSVVWVNGRMWTAGKDYWFSIDASGDEEGDAVWSDLAADAVPVVPVNKVADWFYAWLTNSADPRPVEDLPEMFLAEFGGFDA